MPFFKKRRALGQVEKICQKLFNEEKNLVQISDLYEVMMLGEQYDRRPYVGFNLLQSATNDESVGWLCRNDGNIWAAWYYSPPTGHDLWGTWTPDQNYKIKTHILTSPMLMIPMSNTSKNMVNKFTQELWTMHKLGSDTLL